MPDTVTVSSLSQQLNKHLEECYSVRVENKAALDDLKRGHERIIDEINDFKSLPTKAVRWVALTIGGALLTIVVQNWVLHQETIRTSQAAAVQASDAAQTSNKIAKAVGAAP